MTWSARDTCSGCGPAGRRAHAGPVPSPRRRPDGGDPGVAAAGSLDDRGYHAAVAAPQRPGDHPPADDRAGRNAMSRTGRKVAIITGAPGAPRAPRASVRAWSRQAISVLRALAAAVTGGIG